MLELSMRERIGCSKEEKRGCLPLIEKLIGFAEHARRHGLLAFELDHPDCCWRQQENVLIRFGLKMMVDGLDVCTIKEILIAVLINQE